MRATAAVLATASALLASFVTPAGAATQIGQTFTPTDNCSPRTRLQISSPGDQYAAPFAGVITSWSFERSSSAGEGPTKLKVARSAGGDNFTIVGESPGENPLVGLNTYLVRIPIQAGDVIGVFTAPPSVFYCSRPATGYTLGQSAFGEDVALGATAAFSPVVGQQLGVSATLEPDCDDDGFGDESQDADTISCPPAPETTITSGPKDKTKKKTAIFEFSSNEAGSTFECSLDGATFAACSSPHTVKVKKGRHTFSVRAKDAGNNVESTPATDEWKVKKKKKRR
ncbi:MAG TPA: hypothetical protein VEK39_02450 [Solirubrobacterales bacterium]|nr:hypothetical protein [Solirubrobacterales bacterium]